MKAFRLAVLLVSLVTLSACAPRQDPGIPVPPPVPDNAPPATPG